MTLPLPIAAGKFKASCLQLMDEVSHESSKIDYYQAWQTRSKTRAYQRA